MRSDARKRIRAAREEGCGAEGGIVSGEASIAALVEKYERLAGNDSARYCRAQDVAADLRSLSFDAAEEAERLRAGVLAVVARMRTRNVDHRHEDEVGYWGVEGRAYFYAGDVYDDFADLCALLGVNPLTLEPTS